MKFTSEWVSADERRIIDDREQLVIGHIVRSRHVTERTSRICWRWKAYCLHCVQRVGSPRGEELPRTAARVLANHAMDCEHYRLASSRVGGDRPALELVTTVQAEERGAVADTVAVLSPPGEAELPSAWRPVDEGWGTKVVVHPDPAELLKLGRDPEPEPVA